MRRFLVSLNFLVFILICSCASVPSHDVSKGSYKKADLAKTHEVIFIHGMFMTPKCWEQWQNKFKMAGFSVAAPAWPLHEGSVEDLRNPTRFKELSQLTLNEVVESYRKIIKTKSEKPILIGHSMGGLVAQILLAEGYGSAAVAIDSAPPHGVFDLSWSGLKSNWGIINPFASEFSVVENNLDQFSYAFTNEQTSTEQQRAYENYYVPESRKVGKAPLTEAGDVINTVSRGPLLLIAGGKDHIIPAELTYKNFKFYKNTPSFTEFILFKDRDHWTIAGKDWESVADQVLTWIKK